MVLVHENRMRRLVRLTRSSTGTFRRPPQIGAAPGPGGSPCGVREADLKGQRGPESPRKRGLGRWFGGWWGGGVGGRW